MKSDMEKRFANNIYLQVAHSHNLDGALKFKEELAEYFPNMEIHVAELSLSVACHIGQGALAVAASKKVEVE